jgi:hypothetical protein
MNVSLLLFFEHQTHIDHALEMAGAHVQAGAPAPGLHAF